MFGKVLCTSALTDGAQAIPDKQKASKEMHRSDALHTYSI
jgi:hypothetical protein